MRVLCVDDELNILELMAEFLDLLAIDTVTATDGQQGLEIFLADSDNFDAVISDMKMPRMSGLDFLKELRAKGHNVPFIMASGQFDENLAKKAKAYGLTAILAKPFTLSTFEKMLEKVIGQ